MPAKFMERMAPAATAEHAASDAGEAAGASSRSAQTEPPQARAWIRLLRFSLRGGGIVLRGGQPAGADLHLEGPVRGARGRADVWSKIMFQQLARSEPVLFESVLAAAAGEAEEDGEDMEAETS